MRHQLSARTARTVRSAIRHAIGMSLVASLASTAMAAAQPADELAEVVVTAQFREQNLQDTPLAITAMSAAIMESRSQTNIADLTNQAPSVTLKQQGATYGPSMAASIRGVGQTDFNPAVEPGVGIYVDDVYYATLTGSVLDLLDLDRVEILRGPQGTLAGRNSIGGAVKLYSKQPKGDDTGSVSATYGSRRRVDLRASGDFAISDNLFAHVAAVSKKQDGYIARVDYGCANPGNPYGIASTRPTSAGCVVAYDSNVNYSGVRAALRWIATDNLEFTWSTDYTSDHRNPTGTVLLDYRTLSAGVLANIQPVHTGINAPGSAFVVPWGSYYNYASYYNPAANYNGLINVAGAYNTSYNGAKLVNYGMVESRTTPGQFFDGWGTSLNTDWTLAEGLKLKSITAYREYKSGFVNDNDLSPLSSSIGDGTLPFHSFSEELRLNGGFGGGRFDYTLGAFYMRQTSRYQSWQDLRYTSNYPLQFQQNDVVNADSKAAFGQLGYKVTDQLDLTAGVRYTEEHKDYTFVRLTRDGAVQPFLGALNGLRSDYDGNKLDYRLAGQYRWNDQVMTYLQYSTGFKGGGISPRPFVPTQAQPFNPEKLDSWELGAKTDFFDRKLRLNGDVFYSKYKDIQIGLQLCPGAPCGQVANAGDATIKGAELEAVWRPIGGLSFDASFSYLHFQYDYLNPQVGTSIQMSYIAPFMPTRKWAAGVQYEFNFGDKGTLTPRIDANYQGSIYTSGTNLVSNFIPAYTLGNARLTWKDGSNKWESSLELTNITDKWYLLSRTDQYSGAGHTDGQPGRPREWALTVKRKF